MKIMETLWYLGLGHDLSHFSWNIDGIKSKNALFSQYNPISLLDIHQQLWPSLAQQTFFKPKTFDLKNVVWSNWFREASELNKNGITFLWGDRC